MVDAESRYFGLSPCSPLMQTDRHFPDEVRVFAERLLGPAPAGVPGQVHVGRPDGEAHAGAIVLLEIDPGFIPFDGPDLAQDLGVPRFAQADRLREGGGRDAAAARPSPNRAAPR